MSSRKIVFAFLGACWTMMALAVYMMTKDPARTGWAAIDLLIGWVLLIPAWIILRKNKSVSSEE